MSAREYSRGKDILAVLKINAKRLGFNFSSLDNVYFEICSSDHSKNCKKQIEEIESLIANAVPPYVIEPNGIENDDIFLEKWKFIRIQPR